MKVALIADSLWLMQELTTFRRLVVGLLDEQVRVVRVVPQWAVGEQDQLAMAGDAVAYPVASWHWLRDRRLKQLADQLREQEVDLLHVLDGSLQRVGLALGEAMNVPVICSLWTREFADQLSSQSTAVPVAYAAATDNLVERARKRLGSTATVVKVPPGVYTVPRDEVKLPLSRPREALSVLVIGSGSADVHFQALIEAMALVREPLDHANYFIYCGTADQHAVWQMGERFKLLNQVSLVPGEPGSRELMVQADVVIAPQPTGRARTLLLEAMGAARPVLAAEDPVLDYLRGGETAILLPSITPEDWAAWLRRLVDEPQRLIDLGLTAQQYVQQHHGASRFVVRMLELYHRMAAPQNLPFRA